MLLRAISSLALAIIISTAGFLIAPDLGRAAGPALCAGTLEPDHRHAGLSYRCIAAADGAVAQVPADLVVARSVPLLAALLTPLLLLWQARAARRAEEAQLGMYADLASAVTARAEVLRIVRHWDWKRQLTPRSAELRMVLWVQPPQGRPYEATVAWLVDEHCVGRLGVGVTLQVQINPRRPEKVYPAQPWAHYAWWS